MSGYHSRISVIAAILFLSVSFQNLNAQVNAPFISESSFLSDRYGYTDIDFSPGQPAGHKSVVRAVVSSLIIPGSGEWYAGNFTTGRYLLGSEVSLWLSILGFHSYGSWLKNDAQSFAEVYAGTDWSGKDDKFFVNVGNFMSREEYNEKKMRDRDIGALYLDPAYNWQWESDEKRREFRDLRVRSDQMFNAIKFVGAAIVANHIVSAILAGNAARQYNERLDNATNQSSWSFGIAPLRNGFVAGIQHTF